MLFFIRLLKISIVGVFAFAMACTSPQEHRNPAANNFSPKTYTMEVRNFDSVILYWNAPPYDPDSVKYYELFLRTLADTNWTRIKTNIPPAKNPEAIIYRDSIASKDSLFYFSVGYVTVNNITSEIHYSSDSTAVPHGGWFLLWKHKTN